MRPEVNPNRFEISLRISLQIFDQNRFIKNSFKVNEKNNLGFLRINQIMSKLLTLSSYIASNSLVVCIVTLYFEYAEHFHISHFNIT